MIRSYIALLSTMLSADRRQKSKYGDILRINHHRLEIQLSELTRDRKVTSVTTRRLGQRLTEINKGFP